MDKGKKDQKVVGKQEAFNPKKYEKNGLTEDDVMDIKEAFDLFDTNHSGTIETNELKKALEYLGIDAKNQTLQNMMNDIDRIESGTIDFDKFIEMIIAKLSDKDTPEDLRKIFDYFIWDDTADKIELKHLKRVSEEIGVNMSDNELFEMIVRADTDKDGKVSFDEFTKI